jgi:hypothetical protein
VPDLPLAVAEHQIAGQLQALAMAVRVVAAEGLKARNIMFLLDESGSKASFCHSLIQNP